MAVTRPTNIDRIPADKRLHLLAGVLLAALLVGVVLIAQRWGAGYAVAGGGVALGVGVELYQKVRRQGAAEWADAACSAAASVALGMGYQLWSAVM